MSEEEFDFKVKCPKCGYSCEVCCDKIWKHCPLCGATLEVTIMDAVTCPNCDATVNPHKHPDVEIFICPACGMDLSDEIKSR